jgi:ABC-type lipoprotein release transport system permease subunit
MDGAAAATLDPSIAPAARASARLTAAIAWRNLWRNRRRTWLTAGGIAFAVLLLLFSRSMQLGSYRAQIEATTALVSGHIQLQEQRYLDEPKLEYLVPDAGGWSERIANLSHVTATTPRSVGFALLSVGERSFGAQVSGVVPANEQAMSTLPATIASGRYLQGGPEAVLGKLLARNLGASLGDELLVLGTGPEGGVAALALEIVGIFETGMAALDRSLVQVPLEVFNEGFYLQDRSSFVMVLVDDIDNIPRVAKRLGEELPDGLAARSWQELMPEIVQGIALDRISALFMYAIITLIVLFSIVNTFMMTVFERTREFGMLLAIGMRPMQIVGMLQLEALWLALLGSAVGCLLAVPLLNWLIDSGIPIEGMQDLMMGMIFPDRIRGAFLPGEMLFIPLMFVAGCQVAVLLTGHRVFRMQPVEALRAE